VRFDSALPDAAQNETVTALLDELSGVADDAGFVLHATGAPIFGAVTDGYFRRDLGLLTPTATGSRSTHVVAGIYLDVGTAMIASIVLGVSVDDTVYFLTHYRDARRRGADVRAPPPLIRSPWRDARRSSRPPYSPPASSSSASRSSRAWRTSASSRAAPS